MRTDFRALCAELVHTYAYCIDRHMSTWAKDDALVLRARAALAEPADAPPASPAEGEVAELVAWLRENAEDERQMSRGDNPASLKLDRAAELLERHAAPVPAETLAARPLIEQVAAMGDCIGQQTVGQIMSLASRAASWLAENPPGQRVAIEPRGCPTPGACSCLERHAAMENLAADAVSGLRYIEQSYGRLYGVGWDRVFDAAATLQPAHALPLPAPQGGEVEP